MSRSIFDPTGGETEHSGSRNLGPRADNISHMPPRAIDGEVPGDDEAELKGVDAADDTPDPLTTDPDEAARRLRAMSEGGEG